MSQFERQDVPRSAKVRQKRSRRAALGPRQDRSTTAGGSELYRRRKQYGRRPRKFPASVPNPKSRSRRRPKAATSAAKVPQDDEENSSNTTPEVCRYFGHQISEAFAGVGNRDRPLSVFTLPLGRTKRRARQGVTFRMADHFVSLKDLTPEERRLREAQRRSDAELAIKEHQEARRAFFENRDRLRALRLAREAEQQK